MAERVGRDTAVSTAADRIASELCGCRYDIPTRLATHYCEEHDARQLVADARRIIGAVIHRQGRSDEDLEAVFGLLDHALEAMSR